MPKFAPIKEGEIIKPRPRLSKIFTLAATAWGITYQEIQSRCRKQLFVNARHSAFLIASEWLYSQQEIADAIGLDCHTTVCHGVKKASYLEQYDLQYGDKVRQIRQLVLSAPDDVEEEIERVARENRERSVREILAAIKLEQDRADEIARRKRALFDNSDPMFKKQAEEQDSLRDASRDFAKLLEAAR